MRHFMQYSGSTQTALVLAVLLWGSPANSADTAQSREPPPLIGIGVAFKPPPTKNGEQRVEGAVEVMDLVPNRPAHLCGEIEIGDLVTAVSQADEPPQVVDGLLFSDLVNLIRGPADSEVRLTLVPGNNRYVKSKVVALRREPLVETDLIGRSLPSADVLPLSGSDLQNLDSLRGSVVVLEFWSTSCAPCRAHISELQEVVTENPSWAGSVECLTVSVDESVDLAKAVLAENDWTATVNVWGSEEVRRAFHADILPLVVIADRQGMIVAAGNPRSVNVEGLVKHLLEN
jgi:thiol-disulfide isomerase/thioredoxin